MNANADTEPSSSRISNASTGSWATCRRHGGARSWTRCASTSSRRGPKLASDSEAEVHNVLDRLGDPAEIAAEARRRFGVRPRGSDWREVSAIVLLLLGGFVAFVGWIVGVILLWLSDRWTTRDKLIGSLVVPGGLFTSMWVLIFAGSTSLTTEEGDCSEASTRKPASRRRSATGADMSTGELVWTVIGLAFVLFCLVGPLFTTVYLALRLRRSVRATELEAGLPAAS